MQRAYRLVCVAMGLAASGCSTAEEDRQEARSGADVEQDGAAVDAAAVSPRELIDTCVLQEDGSCPEIPGVCCHGARGQRVDIVRGCMEPIPFVVGCVADLIDEPDEGPSCRGEDWFSCRIRVLEDGGLEYVYAHEYMEYFAEVDIWTKNGYEVCQGDVQSVVLTAPACE